MLGDCRSIAEGNANGKSQSDRVSLFVSASGWVVVNFSRARKAKK